MSTVKANAILDASGGTTASINGYTPTLSNMAGRNRIINGDMRISQRGVTISSGIGALTYTLDRWSVAAAGAAVSVSAQADPTAPYTSFMGIAGAAGNTVVGIRQRIEWLNTADLAGQTVTVSFYCYNATSNATSATVQLNYPTARDNYASITSSATQAITLSNTGRQSFTFTVPAAAANGIELNVFVNNLTSGVLVFREVQLEAGSVATPFERRPYGTELALCQRYCWKTYSQDVAIGAVSVVGCIGVANTSTASTYGAFGSVSFPVEMRAAPTITYYNGSTGASGSWRAAVTDYAMSNAGISPSTRTASFGNSSVAIPTQGSVIFGHIFAVSEL